MQFNLSDKEENLYKVNTIFVDGVNYLIISEQIAKDLGFSIKLQKAFINKRYTPFDKQGSVQNTYSIFCDDSVDVTRGFHKNYDSDNCSCVCNMPHLSFWKRKRPWMESDVWLTRLDRSNEPNLYYLFELIEK